MKSYLITDPKYYSNQQKLFEKTLTTILQNNIPDMACFRDKTSQNIEELIEIFTNICHKKKVETIFINNNIELAMKYKANGVHLTSTQFDKIQYAKNNGLKVIISCHTQEEIESAIEQKADFITYSPIFATPNKGEPKGVAELQRVVKKYPINIIALGGIITKEHLQELEKTGVYGFASIRYFI
jgi:thiamine-phosphate pyrophosphorylase